VASLGSIQEGFGESWAPSKEHLHRLNQEVQVKENENGAVQGLQVELFQHLCPLKNKTKKLDESKILENKI
jgi:hypothetical protein